MKPVRSEVEKFKEALIHLLDHVDAKESEEFNKNLLSDFLKKAYYSPDHFVNTKGRNDQVIHNGKTAKTSVGVIIETKRPGSTEMISEGAFNKKAMQELVLYFLRERITQNNLEVKHLVATDVDSTFIFDATEFEKHFVKNKELVKQFKQFEAEILSGTKTEYFYKEIASPAIEKVKNELVYTYFRFAEYEKALRNDDPKDDKKLVPLFKLLSPQHLLKRSFLNDSNSLDRKFYSELLHIIGLTEVKIKNKKVIQRKKEGERDNASLLENAVAELDSLDKLSRLPNVRRYGEEREEQLFNIGLELSITWVNRVLFLKLLEAQLLSYHGGDNSMRFLDFKRINNYDALNSLFFKVLARTHDERRPEVKEAFAKVPYLNSSLFEPNDLEHDTLTISNLGDELELPMISSTVLKDDRGKKRTGTLNALQYLFAFLDAYDFSSEGGDDIQEEGKQLINASVLGLIFEKINGYKDGSFFTPGFITEYMCRETLRRAVLQKFKEAKDIEADDITGLHNALIKQKVSDAEANELVNSLRICDPAVGSGHFLVSALNELIAIKSELGILADKEGKLLRVEVEVENDQLMVTINEEHFQYNPKDKESQRIQETLFREKQTLIENCLFGVDINPNSVKICRLRLWIELLKNAYYKTIVTSSGVEKQQLETLPNIDINIKCGNSLISRFALDSDLKPALGKSKKWNIETYRLAVDSYRNATSKEQKREMLQLINDIKSDFRSGISQTSREQKALDKASSELYYKFMAPELITEERTAAQKKKLDAQRKKLEAKVTKLKAQVEAVKNNVIFENAFEWRFEFPEVLDDDGAYVGFDVVIGNPPYIRQEEFKELKPYLADNYSTYAGTADLFVYFVELGLSRLKKNGEFIFIIPNKWMRAGYGKALRAFVKEQHIHAILDFGDLPVFEEATTYPCILSMARSEANSTFTATHVDTLDLPDGLTSYVEQNRIQVLMDELQESGWTLTDSKVQMLLKKIREQGVPLGEYVDGSIYYGIKTGYNEAFVIDSETRDKLIAEDPNSAEIIKPFLAGRDIKRYQQPVATKYLILIKNGDTRKWFGKLTESEAWKMLDDKYPAITVHLEPFRQKAKARYDQGEYWWELRACDYYEEFEKEKIMYQVFQVAPCFIPDQLATYCNNSIWILPKYDLQLLAILNSHLGWFLISHYCTAIQNGYQLIWKYLSNMPIPIERSELLVAATSNLVSAKQSDPTSDTTALEAEIDRMVYELYGLTEEEVAIVEGSTKP